MTRHKGFKQLVRERMTKTGERYAAARRALDTAPSTAEPATANGYRLLGGVHPETASLRNLLANRSLELTEAQVLGIGGGLGAGYILWRFRAHESVFLSLGFRNRWQYPVAAIETTARRLGIVAQVLETSGAKGARIQLDDLLDAGEPVIAFVDPQELGAWGIPPERSGFDGSQIVVFGRRADGTYLVDDRGRAALHVDPETMARARGRISSFKHRIVRIAAPVEGFDAARLRRAYEAGLADQVEHLRSTSDSFGLPAWRKWSRTLVDGKHAKGWRRVFDEPDGLFGTLLSIVEGVDGGVGGHGGHLRELYAAFLDDAASVLDRPGLAEAATHWRAAGDLWEDLADAAVPAWIVGAAAAVEAAEELHDAVMDGEPGRARARQAARRLWEARRRYARDLPVPKADVDGLFADLSRRLAEIHAAEVDAVEATARGAGG